MFFAMLAMSVTNAYLCTLACCKTECITPPDHATFIEDLAYELKDNIYMAGGGQKRPRADDD